MKIDKKKNWLEKLLAPKNSSCCSIHIEEAKDETNKDSKDEDKRESPCCCESCEPAGIIKD